MSENKPNWAEKTIAVSGVIQNLQLEGLKRRQEESNLIQSQIASAESARLSIERERQSQEEREDQIREVVFLALKDADDLRTTLKSSRSETARIAFQAHLIDDRLKAEGIETNTVRAHEDKERIHQMYTSLIGIMSEAEAQMDAAQIADFERAARYYHGENAELARLIQAELQLAELQSTKTELEKAKAALARHEITCPKRSGMQKVINVLGLCFLILGVIIFAPCAYGWEGAVIGGLLIGTGAALRGYASIRRPLQLYKAKLELLKSEVDSRTASINELEAELGLISVEALREQFGKDKTVQDYQRMLDERRAWLNRFIGTAGSVLEKLAENGRPNQKENALDRVIFRDMTVTGKVPVGTVWPRGSCFSIASPVYPSWDSLWNSRLKNWVRDGFVGYGDGTPLERTVACAVQEGNYFIVQGQHHAIVYSANTPIQADDTVIAVVANRFRLANDSYIGWANDLRAKPVLKKLEDVFRA